MLFTQNKELAVLESKFEIYEELSKEMLDKLERAVATISENSNRISLILERHEARLDQSDRNDQAFMKLVEKIESKIKDLENSVENLIKFRWIVVGISVAAITIIQSSQIFVDILTPDSPAVRVETSRR